MTVSFDGYKNETLTFDADGVTALYPVKMKSSGVVENCADGDDIIGVAINVRDNYAAVMTNGFITMKYSGTAPNIGYTGLAADGKGGVKALSTAVKYKVLTIDKTNTTVGFIL